MGTRHEIVGIILQNRGEFVLDVTGGGTWRLNCGWRLRRIALKSIGQRVRISGVRDGFDLLAVKTIDPA